MHGYGYPPEQQPTRRPSSATLITLRVLFIALALLSCGVLAWAAMLRLAVVTRRPRDWWLFGLVLVLNVGLIAYIGALPSDEDVMTDGQAVVLLAWILVVFGGTVTYYLYAEIRHYGPYGASRGAPHAGPHTGPQAGPQAGPQVGPYTGPYGGYAPQRVGPATPTPPHGYPPAPRQSPAAATPPPATPPARPSDAPRTAAPQRLDQVRAELDELSDYLRKEGDNR
ncbi:hypothetical protein ABT001_00465 [Streptomyces sp. NPDC002793]|uniref:hypothetical protein n=1 Tax=Streptomyces sp. NPDC002793 TaxID=3154432 RepID=UPI00332E2A47